MLYQLVSIVKVNKFLQEFYPGVVVHTVYGKNNAITCMYKPLVMVSVYVVLEVKDVLSVVIDSVVVVC